MKLLILNASPKRRGGASQFFSGILRLFLPGLVKKTVPLRSRKDFDHALSQLGSADAVCISFPLYVDRAVTRYRVEAALRDISLVRLFPVTGRTHQLRVHMAHIGHPLLGDTRYFTAESANLAAQYHAPYHQLCAVKLSLIHPITGKTLEIACTPDFSVDILFHL